MKVTWGVTMAVLRDSYLVLDGLSSTLRMTCQFDDWYPCSLSYSSGITSKSTPPSKCCFVLTDSSISPLP